MSGTRRDFLRSTLAAGAVASLGSRQASGRQVGDEGPLPRRVLGRTGQRVTILGLGCAYAGGGLSEAQTRATLDAAVEGGVRYFDAAPEYAKAEERLAPIIKPIREKVFVVTKSYAFEAKQAEKDLAQALKQLRTDYVDLFLQHGVGLKPIATNKQILGKGGSLEFLRKAKAKGLARFIGMSVHSPHGNALELLRASDAWDVVMPYMNYVTRAQEAAAAENDLEVATVSDYEKLLDLAAHKKLGMVGMKVLGGNPGKLSDDFDRAFRYALSVPGVACALIGVRTSDHVKQAVAAARRFKPLTEAEMHQAIRRGEDLVRRRAIHVGILERHQRRDEGSTWLT